MSVHKIVKGAKYQKRPSASYFYKKLKVPVGYIVEYRPRKGGKMIKHSLQLRKNGSPYWTAEEKLSKKRTNKSRTKYKGKKRSISKRNKKRTKRRSSNRTKRLRGVHDLKEK